MKKTKRKSRSFFNEMGYDNITKKKFGIKSCGEDINNFTNY